MGARDDTAHYYDDMIGRPVMGLVYLVFVFLPLLFWSEAPGAVVVGQRWRPRWPSCRCISPSSAGAACGSGR